MRRERVGLAPAPEGGTPTVSSVSSRRGRKACIPAPRAFTLADCPTPRGRPGAKKMTMAEAGYPPRQGLYDPALEHDSCGFGFVADIKGRTSHDIVVKALEVLLNLEHRGATGAEKDTGDGAGILLQTPHAFLAAECRKLGLDLPGRGRYGVGMVFLPPSEPGREAIGRLFQETVRDEGQDLLGWRDVPTDNAARGATAKASQPVIRQIFIGRGADVEEEPASPATGGARMRGASEEEPASPA